MSASYYIGTSGWRYPHWPGPFYPWDLAPAAWLGYYAQHFATVEVNASFYRLPSSATARVWKNATPAGFTFAIKASRYITHMFDNDEAGYAARHVLALRALLEVRRV